MMGSQIFIFFFFFFFLEIVNENDFRPDQNESTIYGNQIQRYKKILLTLM